LTLSQLLKQKSSPKPQAISIQAGLIKSHLPDFLDDNHLDLLAPDIEPRIWIGNHLHTRTHQDVNENLACVVAGKRRFVLFPPDQLENLYIGPIDNTVAGTPASMVNLDDPDFERFPKFQQALDQALYADLDAGDILYIPYMWWHNVTSHAAFNILVNYWWQDSDKASLSPVLSLLLAMALVRDLPENYKSAWKATFDHYIFDGAKAAGAYLPDDEQGLMARLSPDQRQELITMVTHGLRPD